MFSVGDTVSYGTNGICRIEELTEMTISKVKKQYFVLIPVQNGRATVYVPTDNEMLLKKMRAVLSVKEINKMIDMAAKNPIKWIEDDIVRKEHCSNIIKSGDRYELMRLIEMLYLKREELKNTKKHFHISDEKYLCEAERLLHDEFSYTLNISKEEVPDYILSRIKK
ncbi:MAG: CarD family transcriptional regulator [Clostridia bacterium]|nr:CarD family transcriptional regulator [Clostridia bacterium]